MPENAAINNYRMK